MGVHSLGFVRVCLWNFWYGWVSVMSKEDLDKAFDTELSDDRVASSFVGWSKFEFVFE